MRWILTCFLLFKLSAQETKTLTDNKSLLIVQENENNILRKEVKDGANNSYAKQCFEYNGEGKLTSIPWAYASRHLDTETGLIYFGARYYDPDMRRFLTRDPLELFTDDNPYAYVQGNPIALFDKNGRAAFAAPLFTFVYGAGTAAITTTILPAAAILGTFYCGYLIYENQQAIGKAATEAGQAISNFCRGNPKSYTAHPDNTTSTLYPDGYWEYAYKENSEPPYNGKELGDDPTKCPGEGFEWRGKGSPESGKGNWVKGEKGSQERLNPDLDHPPPVRPHWDYHSPEFPRRVRLNLDGTWEWK